MAQVAQAPAYGGLRQTSFDRPRTSSQDEEEVVSVRCAALTPSNTHMPHLRDLALRLFAVQLHHCSQLAVFLVLDVQQ